MLRREQKIENGEQGIGILTTTKEPTFLCFLFIVTMFLLN
jgi:hypothetical protein